MTAPTLTLEELDARIGSAMQELPDGVVVINARKQLAILKLARRALVTEPVVQACVDWQGDTGECHFCGFSSQDFPATTDREHDDDCPLVEQGIITRSGARTEGGGK